MPTMIAKCWLVLDNGNRFRIDGRGLLIGRSVGADIHLPDPAASRRQALVYLDTSGLQLVRLGRAPVHLNGELVCEQGNLEDQDLLQFPGTNIRVKVQDPPADAPTGWVLRHSVGRPGEPTSTIFADLPRDEFRVGQGPDDHLRLMEWPVAAIQLTPCFPNGWEAVLARGVTLNGQMPVFGSKLKLRSGDQMVYNSETVRLIDVARSQKTTMGDEGQCLPWKVELQPLPPAGGQMTVHDGKEETTAFFPGLRFDLLQVLLQPPGGREPGEPLPDAVLLPQLWGRKIPSDRKAVTTCRDPRNPAS